MLHFSVRCCIYSKSRIWPDLFCACFQWRPPISMLMVVVTMAMDMTTTNGPVCVLMTDLSTGDWKHASTDAISVLVVTTVTVLLVWFVMRQDMKGPVNTSDWMLQQMEFSVNCRNSNSTCRVVCNETGYGRTCEHTCMHSEVCLF